MAAKSRVLLFLAGCLCQVFDPVLAASQNTPPAPHVDERVELLSIVFRLAGNSEYNMNTLPLYSKEIDSYFASFKDHPAIRMARRLAEKNGIGFDAVMAMSVSLSQPPELKPLVAFTSAIPEERWGNAAEKFLPLLCAFYHDSKFADFFAQHQAMYRTAEERFTTILHSVDFSWYPQFYGKAPDLKYHVILGLNNGGGNYGPHLVYSDDSMELFSIIGCWTHDGSGNPAYPSNQVISRRSSMNSTTLS